MSRPATHRRGLPAAGVAAPKDRRFRRADVAPQRWRFARLLVRLAWRAAPALVVLAVVAAVAWWLLTTPWLSVRRFVVSGNTRLSTGEVLALVENLRGSSILRVNLDHARDEIMTAPWVGGVSLTRVLPSTIQIQVTERVPMAIARAGARLYLVDNTGLVIGPYTTTYRDLDLPIVDGLVGLDGPDPAPSPASVRLTGALLAALADQPALLRAVSQVDVSNPHDAVVLLDGDSTWLHLGDAGFVERLQKYLQVKSTFQEQFADMESIELRYGNRIYVRPPSGRRAGDGTR